MCAAQPREYILLRDERLRRTPRQQKRKALGCTTLPPDMRGPIPVTSPLVSTALPAFENELTRLLLAEGHKHLVDQVAKLRIVDRCRCGDSFCATFYTAPLPKEAWGPDHQTIPLDGVSSGMVNLDLNHGSIVCIEVLYRDDVRDALGAAIP